MRAWHWMNCSSWWSVYYWMTGSGGGWRWAGRSRATKRTRRRHGTRETIFTMGWERERQRGREREVYGVSELCVADDEYISSQQQQQPSGAAVIKDHLLIYSWILYEIQFPEMVAKNLISRTDCVFNKKGFLLLSFLTVYRRIVRECSE